MRGSVACRSLHVPDGSAIVGASAQPKRASGAGWCVRPAWTWAWINAFVIVCLRCKRSTRKPWPRFRCIRARRARASRRLSRGAGVQEACASWVLTCVQTRLLERRACTAASSTRVRGGEVYPVLREQCAKRALCGALLRVACANISWILRCETNLFALIRGLKKRPTFVE